MRYAHPPYSSFFFFNDTATTEIYTLSLHDALPISGKVLIRATAPDLAPAQTLVVIVPHGSSWMDPSAHPTFRIAAYQQRSEEHTSELQSRLHLVCRLLLEKKKKERI